MRERMGWRFWLGAWVGIRLCMETLKDRGSVSALFDVEDEVLERLYEELAEELALPLPE